MPVVHLEFFFVERITPFSRQPLTYFVFENFPLLLLIVIQCDLTYLFALVAAQRQILPINSGEAFFILSEFNLMHLRGKHLNRGVAELCLSKFLW